jgi:hypothetical protein
MSFLSVLKKIGSVALGIEHVAAPIVALADPALAPFITKLDGWLSRTQTAVQQAEVTFTDAKAGGLKQAAVIQDFENGLVMAQDALAVTGKTIQYDAALYQKVIQDFVTAYNDAAAFKATWKIADLVPPPPPAA